jgi:hypothetical protein
MPRHESSEPPLLKQLLVVVVLVAASAVPAWLLWLLCKLLP